MSRLNRKLRGDLKRMRWRALGSVLLITMGSMMFSGLANMAPSVRNSLHRTYDQMGLADFQVYVEGAPENLTEELQTLENVSKVEGRLEMPGRIASEGLTMPAQVLGIRSEPSVNKVETVEGEGLDPSKPYEVLLERRYAKKEGLGIGDNVSVWIAGQVHTFKVRGLATSPEYLLLAVDPHAMIPLPGRMGVIFMCLPTLQSLVNMSGQINTFSFLFEKSGDKEETEMQIILALAPYVISLAQRKEEFMGYYYLEEDIGYAKKLNGAIAFLFLVVAFFVVYSAFSRLISSQRREIGMLRALGFGRLKILISYIWVGLLLGLLGSVIGVVLALPLSMWFSAEYLNATVNVPLQGFHIGLIPALESVAFGPITAGIAVILAIRGVLRVEPHQAIRGATLESRSVRATFLEKLFDTLRGGRISYALRYTCRNLSRRRVRSVLTVVAIGSSMILASTGPIMFDSWIFSIDDSLARIERWDLLVDFTHPLLPNDLANVSSPHINSTESILRFGMLIDHGQQEEIGAIVGISKDSKLHNFIMRKGRVFESGNEAVLTVSFARNLKAGPGDNIIVRNSTQSKVFTVVGVAADLTEGLFIDVSDARELVGKDATSGMYVRCERGEIGQAKQDLIQSPYVSSITEKAQLGKGIKELMESFQVVIYFFVLLGLVMSVLVISNIVMIGVLERYSEYGQMRAIGYSQHTIGKMVFSEAIILVLFGVLLGVPMGWLTSYAFVPLMRDFFPLYDVFVNWPPMLGVIVMTIAVAILSTIPAIRYLGRMDLPKVISERQFG